VILLVSRPQLSGQPLKETLRPEHERVSPVIEFHGINTPFASLSRDQADEDCDDDKAHEAPRGASQVTRTAPRSVHCRLGLRSLLLAVYPYEAGGRAMISVIANGAPREISEVRLYPESNVNHWRALIARAQTQLQGFSSPVGFIGSPGWVIGGSIVSGVISSAISNAAIQAGIATLNEAAPVLARIRESGVWFSISQIEGIERPYPGGWIARGPGKRVFDVSKASSWDRDRLFEKYRKTKDDVRNGRLEVDDVLEHISLDEDFISCRSGTREFQLRWAAVDSYEIV
jgi:hypothetical protein